MYIYQKKKKKKYLLLFFLPLIIFSGFFLLGRNTKKTTENRLTMQVPKQLIMPSEEKIENFNSVTIIKKPLPQPVSMERLKSQGCVADGLFSEFHPENEKYIALVNRSDCYYLHRAVDTWLNPPDFMLIEQEMNLIEKKDVVYGMFIAEALSHKMKYLDEDTGKKFKFDKMCHEGSEDFWGPHTCKADLSKPEYQRYIKYITRKAMDRGIQSFTFGQIYFQEGAGGEFIYPILSDMRDYAKKIGLNIVIGAQTGSITDKKYLSSFDYIEGGVGLSEDGSVEDGPCLSTRGNCWALLWHDNFSKNAKNVLLHLDWSGIKTDDLDIFARMDSEKRAEVLKKLYKKFDTEKTGFLMPFFGYLDGENGGCRGPKKKLYSPDDSYGCKDEDVINNILAGGKGKSQISQIVNKDTNL